MFVLESQQTKGKRRMEQDQNGKGGLDGGPWLLAIPFLRLSSLISFLDRFDFTLFDSILLDSCTLNTWVGSQKVPLSNLQLTPNVLLRNPAQWSFMGRRTNKVVGLTMAWVLLNPKVATSFHSNMFQGKNGYRPCDLWRKGSTKRLFSKGGSPKESHPPNSQLYGCRCFTCQGTRRRLASLRRSPYLSPWQKPRSNPQVLHMLLLMALTQKELMWRTVKVCLGIIVLVASQHQVRETQIF